MELLEKHEFEIESGLAHIPTAFKAVYGKGKPAIGFLGEFDALSGLSQEADKLERKEVEKGACSHGCGHHMLGTASIGAAFQLKDYIEENNLDAKVIYSSYPGEEGGSGKAFMAKTRVFDDADIALT
ncbi:hypothetical protein [Peptoniphilus raoultii]|uniref:hypothetical protein n=1 Tax=Peptoniphilus raoultii TaxID=1776387 RepID=UPI000B2AB7AB|nr:hypothetical protein [Peptoniphilus raoultii]